MNSVLNRKDSLYDWPKANVKITQTPTLLHSKSHTDLCGMYSLTIPHTRMSLPPTVFWLFL